MSTSPTRPGHRSPSAAPLDPGHFNQLAWDRLALAGDHFFGAATARQIAAARLGQLKIRVTPQIPLPLSWLEPFSGKQILCLGGGGGQQAPLLAAAGADVTVFDLSPQQLQRDRQVAQQENLTLTTVLGDMADLSQLKNNSFDLIVNPCSVCYCPDVKPIWREAFRVLKPGGQLIAGLINPVYYLFDAAQMNQGKLIAKHAIPYSDLDLSNEERIRLWGTERPLEFGHTLGELLGGQLQVGFCLIDMFEDGWAGGDKLSQKIPTFLATRASKNG